MNLGVGAPTTHRAKEKFLFGSVSGNPAIAPCLENDKMHLLWELFELIEGNTEFGRDVGEVEPWWQPEVKFPGESGSGGVGVENREKFAG